MDDLRSYNDYLSSPVQLEKLTEVCNSIFKFGEFQRLPELTPLIMPIVNIVYYQSIKSLDDQYFAYDDLLQDVLLEIFSDMKLRWDKYIHIDNYYEYIKRTAYKIMVSAVHAYHNYYSVVELSPEECEPHISKDTLQEYVEMRLLLSTFEDRVLDRTHDLLKHRLSRKKLVRDIFDALYIIKDPDHLAKVQRMHHAMGISHELLRFYETRVKYIYSLVSRVCLESLKKGGSTMDEFNKIISRIESSDYETLSLLYGDTILPEIYAEFGQDVLLRFVKLFGGMTLTIPDSRSVGDTILGGTVYNLAEGERDNLPKVSELYGMPLRVLQRIFDKHISDTMRKESYKSK